MTNPNEPALRHRIINALRLARHALEHSVPSDCWVNGPYTGSIVEDYVVCPGCRANHAIDTLLDELNKEPPR